MSAPSTANESRDWVRKPLAFLLWWGLPILGGISSKFLGPSLAQDAFLWAGAFAWMGTGCLLNARRCARLHCFISGPVLWLGALAAALVGIGIVSAPHALEDVVNATVVSAVVSWLPEWFWGRYNTLKPDRSAEERPRGDLELARHSMLRAGRRLLRLEGTKP